MIIINYIMSNNRINFSDILEKYSGPVYEKEYIIPKNFSLNNISNDFHYIKNIKVQPFSQNQTDISTKLQVNYMKITLGGPKNCIYERNNAKLRLCVDKSDFINYDIDFPTSAMYKYHDQHLMLRTGGVDCKLFKIIVTGLKFNELETFVNESIEYKHDSKYYQEGKFYYQTQGGMSGKNTIKFPYWYKQDYTTHSICNVDEQLTFKDMEKITLACKENGQDYNLFVTNNSDVSLLETLALNNINNYEECLVGKVKTIEFEKFDYVRHDNNKMSVAYELNMYGNDVLYSFKILNKVSALYGVNAKIDLLIGDKTYFTNDIRIDDINNTVILDNILINKHRENSSSLKIKITCDDKYIDYFETLMLDVGVGCASSKFREALFKNDLSLCRYL